jgi:type IV secretion system protein VirB4
MTIFSHVLKKYISPSNLIPKYNYHVHDHIISIDNEQLLSIIEIQGIPFETIPDQILFSEFNTLTRIFCELNKVYAPNLAQWHHIIKRKISLEFHYQFTNSFISDFSKQYLKQFQENDFFQTNYAISFVYKYKDNLTKSIQSFNHLINFILNALKQYEPRALGIKINKYGITQSEIGSFLAKIINNNNDIIPISSTPIMNSIQTAEIAFGFDLCEIRPTKGGKKYATYFDLREYPDESKRGMWNLILSEPYEFILTQSFLHLTPIKALKELNQQINKIKSSTNSPEHYIQDLSNIRGYVATGEISLGEYHSALVVYGNTPKEAIDHGNILSTQLLTQSGVRYIRSTSSGIFTYYSMLPGSLFKPLAEPKTTRNLASSFSLNNFSTGKQYGNPIGDGSAILPLKTRSDGIYFFNLHYSSMEKNVSGQKYPGHTLILGTTGSGKTTFETVLVSFLSRFKPKIFAIDYNRSMELFLKTYGATYFNIEDGIETGLQPFQLPPSSQLRHFLYLLIAKCGSNSEGKISTEEEKKIQEAIDVIMLMDYKDRCFSYLSTIIPPEGKNTLGDRLAKWQYSCHGSLAWALDSKSNLFDPRTMNKIGFNTTSLLKNKHPATEAILSVLFYIKDLMQQKGELFLTLVEEFWVPANYKTTQEQIKNTLKAGRIKNEFMILVSQSPEDAIHCKIFADIIQMTPTKIFFPNPEATFETYKTCGINQKEFDDLSSLEKDSRIFLIKQSHQSTFAKLDLTGFDTYLPILSGTWDNLKTH